VVTGRAPSQSYCRTFNYSFAKLLSYVFIIIYFHTTPPDFLTGLILGFFVSSTILLPGEPLCELSSAEEQCTTIQHPSSLLQVYGITAWFLINLPRCGEVIIKSPGCCLGGGQLKILVISHNSVQLPGRGSARQREVGGREVGPVPVGLEGSNVWIRSRDLACALLIDPLRSRIHTSPCDMSGMWGSRCLLR